MKRFRAILFWTHLGCGLIAGAVIGIMCFTGAVLAFEQELTAWAERDARRVDPSGTARLSVDELAQRVRAAHPEFQPATLTLRNDREAAIAFTAGRADSIYADPYTGEVRRPASTKVYQFMRVMTDWHRYLALAGDNRPHGKFVTGVCNLAFLGLAVTGLYLWWPRALSWRSVRSVALLNLRLAGRVRDFNWHNSIGFWMAPILIVLTATAVPISFRWGGNLIQRLAGEEIPAATGPSGAASASVAPVIPPAADARIRTLEKIVSDVAAAFPRWNQITLRLPAAARDRAHDAAPGAQPALHVTVRESGSWPRTATTTVQVEPFRGEILQRSGYAELPASRKVRSWTRFLHTGQALGWPGQLIAGIACLGGLLLVYTGFALSCRRFFGRAKSDGDREVPQS